MRKIYITTPTIDGNVKARYAWSLFSSAQVLSQNDYDVHFLHPEIPRNTCYASLDLMRFTNCDIAIARSRSAHQMLRHTDGTDLLLVDSDVVWTPKALANLIKHSEGKGITGITYPRKDIDWAEVARVVRNGHDPRWGMGKYVYKNDKPLHYDDVVGNCVAVEGIGAGFMMISRDCLQRITDHMREQYTWFDDDLGEDVVCIFDLWKSAIHKRRQGEDYAFCRRWREMGETVWMYIGSGAPVSHEGSFLFEGTAGGMMQL